MEMVRKVVRKTVAAAIALSVIVAGWLTPVMPGADKVYAKAAAVAGETGIISTYAGTAAAVGKSTDVAQTPYGVLTTEDYIYVADEGSHVVRRIDKKTLHEDIIAGNGTGGYSGDGGPATSAQLLRPHGMAMDSKGNLYIVDYPRCIRKVDPSGIISTVKVPGNTLEWAYSIAIDKNDTIYIGSRDRIYKIVDQKEVTVLEGFNSPFGLAIDYTDSGETIVYFAESYKNGGQEAGELSKITPEGKVEVVIGDEGTIERPEKFEPHGLTVDGNHNLYIADRPNNMIRILKGDGDLDALKTGELLKSPLDVTIDDKGDFYIADAGNYLIRKFDADGTLLTVGGNGKGHYSGDGGLAIHAQFDEIDSVAVDGAGNVIIADSYNNRIRKVDAVTGIVTTIAGNGLKGFNGDNIPAKDAQLTEPMGIVVDSHGNIYMIDDKHLIRKIDAKSQKISTVTEAEEARGINLDSKGNLYVSFEEGIGKLDSATGELNLAYTRGMDVEFSAALAVDSKGNIYFVNHNSPQHVYKADGNGDVSVYATGFDEPQRLLFDRNDNLYVVDWGNAAIRKVGTSGEMTLFAGKVGSHGYAGDSGPANEALLSSPYGIAMDLSGDIYIADKSNYRIRKVDMPDIPATALNATAASGSAYGTTSVTAAVYEGHQLIVKVSPSAIPTPLAGDAAPAGTGVIAPYMSGTNIGGVDATTNKYVGVYEVNQHGRVIAFKEITLTAAQINSIAGGWTGGAIPPTSGSKPMKIMVDGKEFGEIATVEQTDDNGKTAITVTLDTNKLAAELSIAGEKPTIVIPVASATDKVSVVLTGEAAMALETKQATLEIRTPNGNYRLPADEVMIDDQAKKLDEQAKLADLTLRVDIAKSDAATVKLLDAAAATGAFKVAAPPVEYTVVVVYKGKTVEVDRFSSYVKREIPLASGANDITTAIVLDRDGTFHHVPTSLIIRDGKPYAVVSSLSNSTYALITHTARFADVEGHWSNEAVNDLASRFVVSGADEEHFKPNAAITRAEFAALIVRALGLSDKDSFAEFKDVKAGQWFTGAVGKAQEYGIITGYEDGSFRPTQTITRAEAMVIIARAMDLAGLEATIGSEEASSILSEFKDGKTVGGWAVQAVAAAVKNGLVSGSEGGLLPASKITRAETASMIQRLLKQAGLTD